MAASFQYSSDYSPPAPVARITLHAQHTVEVIALLDSGADATILPYGLLKRIGARFAQTNQMRGIAGKPVPVALYFVTVQIDNLNLPGIKAVASRSSNEAIIGRDVLNHLIVTLDGIAGQTEIS